MIEPKKSHSVIKLTEKRPHMLVFFLSFSLLLASWGMSYAVDDTKRVAGFQIPESRKPAPGFELEDVEGRKVTLKDFRGKMILLDFWTTW